MDIVANLIIGFTNGIFSSGAGQILLLYYVYLKKYDTKEVRNLSLMILPLISIPSLFYYFSKIEIKAVEIALLCVISAVFGTLGNIIMKKINPNVLNLISGIVLVAITVINMWCVKWFILYQLFPLF